MIPDWEEEWVNGWEDDESSVHILCGQGAMTPLPPPTWNIVYGPHTNSHTQWQNTPVPVPGPPVFICFHTYKTISGSSSPHVAPAEQLRCWITGKTSAESFPVCSTTEEKITHPIISWTFPTVLTKMPFFYRESSTRQHTHERAHVWIRTSVCRCWFPFIGSYPWEQTEGNFLWLHTAEMGQEVVANAVGGSGKTKWPFCVRIVSSYCYLEGEQKPWTWSFQT